MSPINHVHHRYCPRCNKEKGLPMGEIKEFNVEKRMAKLTRRFVRINGEALAALKRLDIFGDGFVGVTKSDQYEDMWIFPADMSKLDLLQRLKKPGEDWSGVIVRLIREVKMDLPANSEPFDDPPGAA